MSQSRQDGADGARDAPLAPSGDEHADASGVAADFEAGHRLPRPRHERAQLVYAVEGVMTVETAAGLWVVPPLRAVWVPPGVVHSIRMTGRVRMRTIYFAERILAQTGVPDRCAVLGVSPLMRELVLRIVEGDASDGSEHARRRERLLAVVLDEIVEAPVTPLEIPMPTDERVRRVADAVLADPADNRDLAAWASYGAMSERTLARLFPQETGMTFVRWRQQVRLVRGLEKLATGEPVTTVALELGYTSTSAFVKLFRESLGVTPGRYFSEKFAGVSDAQASARD